MRYLRFGLAGVALVVGVAWWLRGAQRDEREALVAFCHATRRGEPWPAVEQRAAAKAWPVEPASAAGKARQEYLVTLDSKSVRLGCRVTVEAGRVVDAQEGELPR